MYCRGRCTIAFVYANSYRCMSFHSNCSHRFSSTIIDKYSMSRNSNRILRSIRIPDPKLIAEFPHADFDKALEYAQRTNSQSRGPMLGDAHQSYYQAIASSVKYLTRQHMEQQEREYQIKQQRLEQQQEQSRLAREAREKARENNVFGLLNLPRQKYPNRGRTHKKPVPKAAHIIRAIPEEVVPTANLLGLNDDAFIETAKHIEKAAESAELAAIEANTAYEEAQSRGQELETEIKIQTEEADARIRHRVKNHRSGHGQPSNHNQLEHWKSGMQRTWAAMRQPVRELIQQTHKIADAATKHAQKLKTNALVAKRKAEQIANSHKNLLVFPSRANELNGLFKNKTRRNNK